jgi:hypothetical protein
VTVQVAMGLWQVIRKLGCRVKENSVGGNGVSKALKAGQPSSRDERHVGPKISWIGGRGGGCVAWSQIFLFSTIQASWVGIFRGAFISLSSSLLYSAIDFLWYCLGDPSVPGSAIGSYRLLLPIVFQGFWLGVPLIFPESTLSSHVLCWLPSLT